MALRNENNYSASKTFLEIKEVSEDDIFFSETGSKKLIKMMKVNISAKTREGAPLPDQELSRRKSINDLC